MSEVSEAFQLTSEDAERLLELLEEEGRERIFLHQVLELWRDHLGLDSVAAYVDLDDDGLVRCVSLGSDGSPESLARPEDAAGSFRRIADVGMLVASGDLDRSAPPVLELLVRAGLRLCRFQHRLKRHDFDAKYRGVELEAIYDVGLAIASTLDLSSLTEEILLRAVSLLDARRGALYLLEGGRYVRRGVIGASAPEWVPMEIDPSENRGTLLPDARYHLAVPVEIEGKRRGLLVVGDKESRTGVGPFPSADRRSLAHFANQAALALEQARLHQEALEKQRLEREMELASQIQRGILPRRLPEVSGWEIEGWTRPARHVGGDYYDLVRLPEGRLAALVADVSGKGVPAALLVSTIHSALRLLLDRGEKLALLGRLVNDHLFAFSTANKFATLFLGAVDPDSGHLAYLNAGHNPAFLVRSDGSVESLGAGGVPLGLFGNVSYEEGENELFEDDLLCIYSDGFTEATSPSEEEFGEERLSEILLARRRDSLEEIRSALDEAVTSFSAGLPQADDQTLVLVRRC